MCDGIVLAGGFSSRTQTNKLELPIKGEPILRIVVMTLQQCCNNIVVVGGHYYKEVVEMLKDMERVTVVYNPNYNEGMFSSVLTGVACMTQDFILIPGDYPFIMVSTYKNIIETEGEMVVPIYEGRKGHPILIRQHLIHPLLLESPLSNLKKFRDRYQVTYLPVEDKGILMDIDTIKEYESMRSQIEGSH
jgi:molybdenum cofactor cytidylyltransferase